ncbi:hypothetical protein HYPSUDRAFT_218573 [Hypholoma sublateritium FD-334 SS-4]|uniref:Uncharacterized protein n=1 Tax=Hypholoma sublateritium (strain FD-334 SS-4) TaxID=945553 RepID=A0A0D2PC34_HYPSF|nr:hypothetical protein HYPSUDRAFT_218573 [Hypholoma sublateritium FD-334 SS-4]
MGAGAQIGAPPASLVRTGLGAAPSVPTPTHPAIFSRASEDGTSTAHHARDRHARTINHPPAALQGRALFIAYATTLRIDAGHECAQASAPRTPGPATRTCAAVPRPWT